MYLIIRAGSVLTETEEPTVFGRFFWNRNRLESISARCWNRTRNRNRILEPRIPELVFFPWKFTKNAKCLCEICPNLQNCGPIKLDFCPKCPFLLQSCNFTKNLIDIFCQNPLIYWNLDNFLPKSRTVRTAEPNSLKPEPKVIFLAKPVGTRTECVLKIRTGTEEFWNRPITSFWK